MAKKVITKTVVTDDFDGNEIQDGHALEVKISIAGTEYRLDLRPENVDKFRAHIRKWLEAAQPGGASSPEQPAERRATPARRTGRPTTKRGSRRKGPSPRRPREEIQAVREWALAHGFEVSPRGRISNEVHDAFKAAH
ncbi:histone-like nucleoid-structuring protein Lsr2 [Nocardia wallacei]|uniref:histone-like nucleoid-structuring protein Lsr2 n=1 Tax=Nocardia wallacei TaxID=480035 RepID=UPI0024559837|nr:Lsr2 family protein [Nocardia wallacei]